MSVDSFVSFFSSRATFLLVSVYVLTGWALVSLRWRTGRGTGLALANLGLVAWLFFWSKTGAWALGFCVTLVLFSYFTLPKARSTSRASLFGLWLPAIVLGVYLGWRPIALVGFSYLSFRLSQAAMEVRSGRVAKPRLDEYLAFAFFLPTFQMGPISPLTLFMASLDRPDRTLTPLTTSIARIIVGACKFYFLGVLFQQLTFRQLWLEGNPPAWGDHTVRVVSPHGLEDLFVSSLAGLQFIWANFSGFCDIAIGIAGLMRIHVKENFHDPFLSRNIQDWWTRFHISLSDIMKELVFTPTVTTLARRLPPRALPHVVAAGAFLSLVLIGLWHQVSISFLLFGVMQGLGVVAAHYYGLFLKRRLGPARFGRYMKSTGIRVVATLCTLVYMSLSIILFQNDWTIVKSIFRNTVW